jgi:serine/threonine protein kinase
MGQRYGDWELDKQIGEGGQAWTHLVHKVSDESRTPFVLKRLKNKADPARLARFEREARAGISLSHPNLLRTIEQGQEGGKPYIVSEYCEGGSLSGAVLKEMSVVQILRVFSAICSGVGQLHSNGYIHRDIKPDNIFLRSDSLVPVVGDFGLCLLLDDEERLTQTHEAVGARWFMAPELAHGFAEDVTHAADVYSLGKLLYWMLAGRSFDREVHRHPRFDLTGVQAQPAIYFIYDFLDQTIVEAPEKRLQTADEAHQAVEMIIRRIAMNAHHVDPSAPQLCMYCGKGHYQRVVDALAGTPQAQDRLYGFGVNFSVGSNHDGWLIMLCDFCGNVQFFRPFGANKDVWKK